jgi:hypothetical protein
LCSVAASKDRSRGRCLAEGLEDLVLKRGEFLVGDQFGVLVSRNVDVDDAAGVNIGREEDGRELDLKGDIGLANSRLPRNVINYPYQALVLCEEHGDAGIDFSDSK